MWSVGHEKWTANRADPTVCSAWTLGREGVATEFEVRMVAIRDTVETTVRVRLGAKRVSWRFNDGHNLIGKAFAKLFDLLQREYERREAREDARRAELGVSDGYWDATP